VSIDGTRATLTALMMQTLTQVNQKLAQVEKKKNKRKEKQKDLYLAAFNLHNTKTYVGCIILGQQAAL
jgi:hypothetical protein